MYRNMFHASNPTIPPYHVKNKVLHYLGEGGQDFAGVCRMGLLHIFRLPPLLEAVTIKGGSPYTQNVRLGELQVF